MLSHHIETFYFVIKPYSLFVDLGMALSIYISTYIFSSSSNHSFYMSMYLEYPQNCVMI